MDVCLCLVCVYVLMYIGECECECVCMCSYVCVGYECLCVSGMGMGGCVRMCQLQHFTISLQALNILQHIAYEGTEARDCVLDHGMVPALMKCVHSHYTMCHYVVFLFN